MTHYFISEYPIAKPINTQLPFLFVSGDLCIEQVAFVATQVPPMDIDKFLAKAYPKQFSHLLNDAGHAPVEQAKVLKEIADTLTAEKRLTEFGLELYKGALRHKVNGQILLTKEQLGELR